LPHIYEIQQSFTQGGVNSGTAAGMCD